MPAVHRDEDPRVCGAETVVSNQSSVYANGKLIAVDGDPNSHGAGELIAHSNNVYVEGLLVVNHTPDHAEPDLLIVIPHSDPYTDGGSPDVFVGDP
jgi:hypothetical protein